MIPSTRLKQRCTREVRSIGEEIPSTDYHFGNQIRLIDAAFVLAVPLVLVAVFLLPESVRQGLVLSYARPSALTMYASHFVHLEASALLSNLLVFLIVVPFALLASVRSGRRRRFYLVAFTILVAFPFVLSSLNVVFPRPRIGTGFSGINLAFVGYLPHALADRVEADSPESTRTARTLLPAAFFVGTTIVVLRMSVPLGATAAPESGRWLLAAGAGSLFAVGACVRPVVRRPRRRALTSSDAALPSALFGSLLFVLVIVAGFPSNGYGGTVITNVFLHFLGYSFGYIVPYIAFRALGIEFD